VRKPELLAPAGNLEKLKIAIIYGADAVYVGGKKYGLRAGADNFTLDELREGVEFAHSKKRRAYVTVNIFARNEDLSGLAEYLLEIEKCGVDGIIVSDPGVVNIARRSVPSLPMHLSTQANCTNWASARFWEDLGINRIILARELSLGEIKEIRKKVNLQLEVFVHGAMCVSYSGRCLLSSIFTGRSANLGDCAHPCRWKYYLMEEKRPGEYFPVFEDERGFYIMNANDLCMIEHIPELVEAGIDSFKIEGRMKSVHYVATVVKTYRQAIDSFVNNPKGWVCKSEWLEELEKVSHRKYSTGFFFGRPTHRDFTYDEASYIRTYEFVGKVLGFNSQTGMALVQQRNKFSVGETVEIFGPQGKPFKQRIAEIRDKEGKAIPAAPHPGQLVYMPVEHPVGSDYLIRKPLKE